jgi:hypothetical protein
MLTRLSLFAWLVSLEAIDVEPERQDALRAGFELAQRAITESLVDAGTQAHGQVARALAELEADGWVAWDWIRYGGDTRPDQPPAAMFDDQALQRVQNVRVTPEGYSAFAARKGLSGGTAAEHRGDEPAEIGLATAVPSGSRYDLFISHASEDKASVARPLAQALTGLAFSVWYDEEQIEIGSSLRMSIETGLAASRYGLVVLSEAFFAKSWTQQELNGLFAREVAGEDVILPLWHAIDADYVRSRAPMLADRFALDTSMGTAQLADRLSRRLRRERGEKELRARASAPAGPPAPPVATSVVHTPRPDAAADYGDDGAATRARTIAMLRANDDIGVRELLRHEQRAFEQQVVGVLQEAGDRLGSSAEPDALQPVERALWAAVDRRLGSLLPLVEYRREALVDELTALAALAGRATPTRAPYAAWLDGPRWPVWLVTLIVGTTALAMGRPEVAVALWDRRAPYDVDRPLPAARLGGGADLGTALLRARGASASPPVELWYPAFAVFDSDLLREQYPEIMRAGETPDAALGFLSRAGDFLWLCGALAGRDGVEMIRFWSASQVHPTLPTRLAAEPGLAQTYAEALGLGAKDLAATLRAWHERVSGPTI